MRYLPFIIISLILYTLFFYNNQQPEILSAKNQDLLSSKIVPLDFDTTTEQKISREAPSVIPTQEVDIVVPSPSSKPIKVARIIEVTQATEELSAIEVTKKIIPREDRLKELLALIKLAPSSEAALLKGELYEQDFYLDLPARPAQKKKPKKKKVTAKKTSKKTPPQKVESAVSELLLTQQEKIVPTTQNSATTKPESKKAKRSFKKQVKPAVTNGQQGLQEAIAVSGNKPYYPKVAKKAQQQGTVTVKFTVNMQGKSKAAQLITSSGHKSLDKAVLDFVKKERFMPALKGIEKVTSVQQFSFKFSLK